MDRITEAIAHFIGLFHIAVEEARLRESHAEFALARKQAADNPDLPVSDSNFFAPHQLSGFVPALIYGAGGEPIVMAKTWTPVDFVPPEIPFSGPGSIAYPGFITSPAPPMASGKVILPEVQLLGSVATYIDQKISLSDDDYFGVGGHGLRFSPTPVDDTGLMSLAGAAAQLSPIIDLEMPGDAAELVDFINTATTRLDETPEELEGATVQKGSTIEGIFVNGVKVEEKPELDDYHSFEEEEEEPEDLEPAPVIVTQNGFTIEVIVEAETGGNTLINNALLKNMWTGAQVTAVIGDHLELNAIIQINAWCDVDVLTAAIDAWDRDAAPTQAFNIATFERFDPRDDQEDDETEPQQGFPQHWVVKEIEGDLMVVTWLKQFTFMTDNDIGILSSSAVTTRVYSGDNTTYNDVYLEEFGFSYDLIIIGGSLYDANIIHQLNILCDNDMVGAVAGFQTTGNGSISTSDNLLWNEAYIYNVGGADRFDSLPDAYRTAASQLAEGNEALPAGISSDAAFAGLGALRVLYVKGDFINLQYVEQTNIIGDSDQVALAMHARDPFVDAEWSIATGGNALINSATILDLDSLGKTYVGGTQYSSEILIQADIISTDPDFGSRDPDQLVNEAVAFLQDDLDEVDDGTGYGTYAQIEQDGPQPEGLQTMLG